MLLDLHSPQKDPRDEHKVHQLQVCGLDSCRFVFFLNIVGYINDAYMVVVGGSRRRALGIVIRSPHVPRAGNRVRGQCRQRAERLLLH
jgi:hypothetical protein